MLDAPVVGRSGKGVATRGEKPGCGLARGGVVTVRLTLEAGIEAPKILRSCSACARAAKTLTSALSLRALDGNVSSCALALRSVPSPLRISDSSFPFAVAKRPRNARSSVTS